MAALQWRLNTALTSCAVWGYYAIPHPQTIPISRRAVVVTDIIGTVLRNETDCETVRRSDPSAASRCFCVGTPWTG
jgi:hypothetical protein